MFSPINIRTMTQSEGAPFIDPCTTVRKWNHDDEGGETHVIYRGWAICPLWFLQRWGALAVTFKKREHVYRDNTGSQEVFHADAG